MKQQKPAESDMFYKVLDLIQGLKSFYCVGFSGYCGVLPQSRDVQSQLIGRLELPKGPSKLSVGSQKDEQPVWRESMPLAQCLIGQAAEPP